MAPPTLENRKRRRRPVDRSAGARVRGREVCSPRGGGREGVVGWDVAGGGDGGAGVWGGGVDVCAVGRSNLDKWMGWDG